MRNKIILRITRYALLVGFIKCFGMVEVLEHLELF